ncbi:MULTISPECIES: HTH-type transcriptional activator IlvY [Spongiibacter]|uniref:HTH-type transcriptional activator IlvY n=1 Tax=Spongiibacter TaxID=630749 RepID=UPI000C5A2639|nr:MULTISPECIES: HTH-type transcriptional activator IlvY [Spongiibacter]MAY38274.1 HTH-type transcriptional activator IlvY [Spongiibacter sp.]|tara:strand:- start:2561 stop:3472 length:912 start_codon:yes stop_codon:yes gene_type:complete
MNSKELEVFIHLSQSLHFGKTSEAMHLSVSAVSRAIQRLEEEVGVKLFERDRRRVRLTAAGREVLRYAEQTLLSWRSLNQRLHQQGEALQGEISLFCSVTASYSVLNTVLEVFRQRYPGIDLKLHTGDQADAVDRIAEGKEDVGITVRPPQLPSSLDYLPLSRSALQLLVPNIPCLVSEQIARHGGDVDAALLASLPFILPERGVARDLIMQWFRHRQLRPNVYAQVSGHEAIVSTVGLGLGIGVVPDLVLDTSFLREKVRVVTLDPELPSMDIGVVVRRQRLADVLVRAFWDCAQSSYRSDN